MNRHAHSTLHLLLLLLLACHALTLSAETAAKYVVTPYNEYNGLSQRYITQIVQGDDGYIWIGTWNGLDRYDGYEFVNFKTFDQNGYPLQSDRIVNILKTNNGNLLCQIDERLYIFDVNTYRFYDLQSEIERKFDTDLQVSLLLTDVNERIIAVCKDDRAIILTDSASAQTASLYNYSELNISLPQTESRVYDHPQLNDIDYTYAMTDAGGNDWLKSVYGIFKLYPIREKHNEIFTEHPSQIRCFYKDKLNRCWVTGKEDKTIRIYDTDHKQIGFLSPDGKIHPAYHSYGYSVYCMYQDNDNRYWLGCKPGGLLCLDERSPGIFTITSHISEFDNEPFSVYDIKQDSHKRLWLATFDKGLICISLENGITPISVNYPNGVGDKVRNILITHDQKLIAASTDGLFIADVGVDDASKIKFKRHYKEPKRANSLSNNATMFLFQDSNTDIYVCTESGGVNRIISDNILADKLSFDHFNTLTGFPSDVALSMIEHNGFLWIVGNNQLIKFNTKSHESETFDNNFFKSDFRFSDAVPLLISDGRWLFGLQRGATILNLNTLKKSDFVPNIALTKISIQNDEYQYNVNGLDTIVLQSHQRSLTINFAALDYAANDNLQYAYRLNNGPWIKLNKNNYITFLDLNPGTYTLTIKSTNHDLFWVNNEREIIIDVIPAWYETIYAKIVFCLFALILTAIVVGTINHIRKINIRHKNLQAYLDLMKIDKDVSSETSIAEAEIHVLEKAQIMAIDDIFIKRALNFVEQHLEDPDINIGDMAQATATSKAGLNRKMKSILGVTPKEFLREVRINKACILLKDKSITINDVACMCGFSDAKYFSRAFKAKKGLSPTEYRSDCNGE